MLDGRHPVPRLAAVATAQGRLLWYLRRRSAAIFVGLLSAQTVAIAGFGIVFGVMVQTGGGAPQVGLVRADQLAESFGLSLGPDGSALLLSFLAILLFAFFWPFGVWSDESPSRRGYHRSLPVDHQLLDLGRVGAGGLALLAVAAAAYGATLLAAALAGHTASISELPAAAWACLLIGPLVPYALSSIAAVRSDRAAAWVLGVPSVVALLATISVGLGLEPLSALLREVTMGRWGLVNAVTGPVLASLTGLHGHGNGSWFSGWVLWLLLAGAGLVAAAGRRRVRRAGRQPVAV